MSLKPYGKKCKCSHFESEHVPGEIKYEDPSAVQSKTFYGLMPLLESKSERKDCKICECVKFNPEKKWWEF